MCSLVVAPTAAIAPERQTVTQGRTATITCTTTGTPPPSVTWRRIGGDLSDNHRITGNILRISQATPSDRGLYVCRAENTAGESEASAVIEVERECTCSRIRSMGDTGGCLYSSF